MSSACALACARTRPCRRASGCAGSGRALAALALAARRTSSPFDAWLPTCGFEGCPTRRRDPRASSPSEGGRILDRNGRALGRLRARAPRERAARRRAAARAAGVHRHRGPALLRRTTASTGAALSARAPAQRPRRAACARGSARSRCRSRATRSPSSGRASARCARKLHRAAPDAASSSATLTKDQILELYLNVIYLGNGVYGVEAASRDLFGKRVDGRHASRRGRCSPRCRRGRARTRRASHRERALARRNLVLALMAREGYLTRRRSARARRAAQRLVVAEDEWRPDANDRARTRSTPCARSSTRCARRSSIERRPHRATRRSTSRAQQRGASARCSGGADASRRRWPATAGRAGRDGRDRSAHRRRARARRRPRVRAGQLQPRDSTRSRQPGSAFKPFVYAAALTRGMTPATMVDDEPVEVQIGRTVWRPANYDDDYLGPIDAAQALAHVGQRGDGARQPLGRRAARRRGRAAATASRARSSRCPSIALGAAEVTPLELVAAYAPFANGGCASTPRLVRAHRDASDGTVLWTRRAAQRAPVDGPARRVPADVDAALGRRRGHGARGARRRRDGTRSPARRARRTTAPTSGSSATRRRSSPASGSATTSRAR